MTAEERLTYRAHAHLVSEGLTEPTVQVRLEARHLGRQPIDIDYDLCGVRLALYRDGAARHLAWRAPLGYATSYINHAGPITVAACGAVRRVATIDPGDSFFPPEFSASYPISRIIGASLQAGWYYAVLDLDVREGTSVALRIAAGWLYVPDDPRPVGQLAARREKSSG
jgi:hypothetical protein